MSENKSKKSGITDYLIHIVIVAMVLLGILIPIAMRLADEYLGWTPPPALQNMLSWMPF